MYLEYLIFLQQRHCILSLCVFSEICVNVFTTKKIEPQKRNSTILDLKFS
jgi:hypothetical protein